MLLVFENVLECVCLGAWCVCVCVCKMTTINIVKKIDEEARKSEKSLSGIGHFFHIYQRASRQSRQTHTRTPITAQMIDRNFTMIL